MRKRYRWTRIPSQALSSWLLLMSYGRQNNCQPSKYFDEATENDSQGLLNKKKENKDIIMDVPF